MTQTPPLASKTRKRIGPFTIVDVIGEGGMGTVYRATRKGEQAAVKMIRPALLDKDDIRQRFEREAELLQSVDNPHVARIIGFDVSKKSASWLATEYIDGPTLKEWAPSHDGLSDEEWSDIAAGVLNGLAAIHAKGIIHRDIKPANIMMSADGPKIIDFGISKEEGQTAFTQTQMFAGTMAYLAPERANGQSESQASDVYSAGLALAYAATGQHPWGDETTQSELSILMAMSSEEPRLDTLSAHQQRVLRALLAKDPAKRPSASEAVDIIRGTRQPDDIETIGVKPPAKKRTWPRFRIPAIKTNLAGSGLRGGLVGLAPFVVVFVAAVLTGLATGDNRIGEAAQIAAWLSTDIFRAIPTAVGTQWLFDGSFVAVTDVALRPSLLTLMVLVVVGLLGRTYAKILADQDSRARLATVATLLGPIIAIPIVISWIVRGPLDGARGDVVVAGMMPWDALTGLAMVGVAFLVGMMTSTVAHNQSVARWWLLAASRFGVLFVAASTLIVLGGIVFLALAPDFSPATSSDAGGPFYQRAFGEHLRLGLWILATLPSLLGLFVSALLSGQGTLALRNDQLVFFEAFATPGSGLVSSITPRDWLLLAGFVLVVVAIAVVAGAYAKNKTDFLPHTPRHLIQVAILALVTSGVVFALLRVDLGVESAIRGTLLAQAEVSHALVAGGVWLCAGLIVAAGLIAGGLPAVARVVNATFGPLAGRTSTAVVTRSGKKLMPWPQLGGIGAIATLAIVTLVVPGVVGGVERALATTNTPQVAFADVADDIEIQDAAGLKEVFGPIDGTWLPDASLEAAQPQLGTNRDIDVINRNGRPWSVGELGAQATVTWPGANGDIEWNLDLDSEITRPYPYVRSVEHTVSAEPVAIDLVSDSTLANVPEARLRINGSVVDSGSYWGVPGNYTVQRDGVLLLAPFEESFTTQPGGNTVTIPNVLALTTEWENALDDAVEQRSDNCGSITRPNCYDADDIERYEQQVSGSIPGSYYDRSNSGREDGGLRCWDPEDSLLSPSEMERQVDCEQTVTRYTIYYDSRTIAEPVYSRRCARYGYSWWFGFYCTRYETYQSGTNYRTVRGSELARVEYRSEIPFTVSVIGRLAEDGSFQMDEATITG